MNKNDPQPDPRFVDLALMAASASPVRLSCQKSHRGVVITRGDQLVAVARNAPPAPFRCAGKDVCGQNCNKVAVHAEERAIIKARCDLTGTELIHVKQVDGALAPSGPPSCWQCSRMILEAGIATVWLYRAWGWESWTAMDFHMATLREHNFPTHEEVDR